MNTTNITFERMLDSDRLISKILKTHQLDRMIFISAWLKRWYPFLFVFHVEHTWWRKLHNYFLITFINLLRLFNSFYPKQWGILNLPKILKFFLYLLRCRHWIETKELHVLNVAENTFAYTHQDIVSTVAV